MLIYTYVWAVRLDASVSDIDVVYGIYDCDVCVCDARARETTTRAAAAPQSRCI